MDKKNIEQVIRDLNRYFELEEEVDRAFSERDADAFVGASNSKNIMKRVLLDELNQMKESI